jgi:hypothetical protein
MTIWGLEALSIPGRDIMREARPELTEPEIGVVARRVLGDPDPPNIPEMPPREA